MITSSISLYLEIYGLTLHYVGVGWGKFEVKIIYLPISMKNSPKVVTNQKNGGWTGCFHGNECPIFEKITASYELLCLELKLSLSQNVQNW